jgi:hypothetical protein
MWAGGRTGSLAARQIREVHRQGSPQPLYSSPAAPAAAAPAPQDQPGFIPGSNPQPSIPVDVIPGMPAPRPRRTSKLLVAVAFVLVAVALAGVAFVIAPTFLQHDPQLTIRSVPDGADIFLNGRLQPAKTPATFGGLHVGATYELRLEHAGFEPISKTVTVPKGQWSILVPIKLKPLEDEAKTKPPPEDEKSSGPEK